MFRYIPLMWKNSLRNRRRSLLTIASVAASLCLLGVLMAMYNALFISTEAPPAQALRLVTRNKISLTVTMPRNWRQKASIKISYNAPVKAPVAKGDAVGKLFVTGDGVPNFSIPLFAADDVPRLGLPGRAMAVLSKYVTGT